MPVAQPKLSFRARRLAVRFRRWQWLMPLIGFSSGVASFVLVERQASLAGWLAGAMFLGWLWLLAENVLGQTVQRFTGYRFPPGLLRFAVQGVHQETFFFVLPFFAITTTWFSGQAAFTGLLAGAGFVSVVDPLYFGRVASRRWLYLLFHGLAVFAITLTALPIVFHLTTAESYLLAVLAVFIVTLPSLWELLPSQAWYRWLAVAAGIALFGVCAWFLRVWVPPATLWLTDVAVSLEMNVDERAPDGLLRNVSEEALHSRGLYAYTAIRAPRGLKEDVYHVWSHDGQVVDRIRLNIQGGRAEGYRAWTHKLNFPADSVGPWKVQVLTEVGQLIGVFRFKVHGESGPVAEAGRATGLP